MHGFSSQVSSRVQYPQDYQDLSYEDLKEFKQTRYGNNWLFCVGYLFLFKSLVYGIGIVNITFKWLVFGSSGDKHRIWGVSPCDF